MDRGQTKRVSLDEIALIKQFIETREDAVLILRDHFLQLELSEEEKNFLKSMNKEFLPVLEKIMYPSIVRDVPLTQQASTYSRLFKLEQINPDVGMLHIEANDILTQYLKQQLVLLNEEKEISIFLKDLSRPLGVDQKEMRVVNMIAFNLIIPIIEGRLQDLINLVRPPEETPEQRKERIAKNSTK